MLRLEIIYGPEKGRSIELHPPSTVIGRSPDNDIQIQDNYLSRNHVRIHQVGDKCFVEDLKSKNGTFVMGNPITSGKKIELAIGHYLAIGNSIITLEGGGIDSEPEDEIIESATMDLSMLDWKDLIKDRPKTHEKNLAVIYKALEAIMGSLSLSEVFDKFMDYLFDILNRIDRGSILLIDNKTGELKEIISRSRYDTEKVVLNYSRTIVNKVIKEGRPTISSDLDQEDFFNTSDTVKLIQSVMCVPLKGKSGIQGVIYVDTIVAPYGFRKEDLALLTALSNSGAIAIENARLYTNMEKVVDARTASLKKTQKKLQESEYRLKAIFENMSSGVMVCRAENKEGNYVVLDLNRAAVEIEKIEKKNVIGQSLTRSFPFMEDTDLLNRLGRVWESGKPERYSMTFSKDGKERSWREYYLYRLPSWEIVAIFNDVTQKKKAEERERDLQNQLLVSQKMESIGRLAGGIAHDFNNMLMVILGNTKMALESMEGRDSTVVSNLTQIQKAAKHSADLTRQLVGFARKQRISPEVLDLNQIIEGMLKMLSRLLGENIDLRWLPKPGLWPVKVDPSQVDQILINLCLNARDAIMDVGLVTIETGNVVFNEDYCQKHEGVKPDQYVMLSVNDNGCGINKEIISNIFEPFFTTKAIGEGTGLGLSTVYGIVKQNHGVVNVSSDPEKGTTFRLYFPKYTEPISKRSGPTMKKPVVSGTDSDNCQIVALEPADERE